MTSKRGKNAQFELAKFTAKRDLYYSEIEELFQLSSKIDQPDNATAFLTRFIGYEDVRERFLKMVEVVNDLNFQLNPEYQPNYELLKNSERFRYSILAAAKRLKKGDEVHAVPQSPFKLPKVTLPEFDGDITQWPLFFEKFKDIIHNNPTLNDLTKLHYLLGSLKGKALDVCIGFTPTAANYPVLLEALKARYDNKRFLADNFFHQMLDLKPLVQESVTGLSQIIVRFDTAYKSLQGLGIPNLADYFMATLLLTKIDPQTRRAFETSKHEKIPSYPEILQFLHQQVEALSQIPKVRNATQKNSSYAVPSSSQPTNWKTFFSQASSIPKKAMNEPFKCPVCSQGHQTFKCPAFAKLSPADRLQLAQERNWCINCLSCKHETRSCNSTSSCKICQKSHHTLLHLGNSLAPAASPSSLPPMAEETPTKNFFTNMNSNFSDRVPSENVTILPTAVVRIDTPFGEKFARFLIDSGSQRHFVTQECCRNLNIPYHRKSVPLEGMGSVPVQAIGISEFTIKSQYDPSLKFPITALVAEQITRCLPTDRVDVGSLHYLKNLPLADKGFFRPGRVDGILGAQLFGKILTGATVVGPDGNSQAVPTSLGYIVLGDVSKSSYHSKRDTASDSTPVSSFCIFDNQELHQLVQRFWKVEEVPHNPKLSREEKICEELFQISTNRLSGRRYCVKLPFKEFPPVLGDSRAMAEKRFYALERKFKQNPQFQSQYASVIQDYLDQGHMKPVSDTSDSGQISHFIPHFAVVKESSTTPLRIVFDASATTTNGRSLNDTLFTGPKLQKDISQILLSFRSSAIALIADIRQMYRNIMVHQDHRRFQRVLWRDSPQHPLQILELNCVVFGLTSAPYLALRTVQQLAVDEAKNFPLAAQLAKLHMYVDDLLVSLDSVSEAREAYSQLVGLFRAGGFKLTKWASNCTDFLETVPANDRVSQQIEFQDSSKINEFIKVLGLIWDPSSDNFSFKISLVQPVFTKRGLLSVVARIWDPLGFLSPVTLYAKLIIKETWSAALDWDDQLPPEIHSKWQRFVQELPRLSDIQIPRHFGTTTGEPIFLVGFADSSEQGYGAVVYLRRGREPFTAHLLYAKSRVAPKKSISIPKLELCAAVLLSDLMKICVEALTLSKFSITKIALTDSTVALNWIKNDSCKRETFVANRVSFIEQTLNPDSWFHVSSQDNIADVISRGLLPARLAVHDSWLHGPPWLRRRFEEWPIRADPPQPLSDDVTTDPAMEEKPVTLLGTLRNPDENFEQFLLRFSSLKKLLRVTVYLLRFGKRLPVNVRIDSSALETAERVIIRQVQEQHFPEEFVLLKQQQLCSRQYRSLSLFLDGDILRVGGRLLHSTLPTSTKHPILLPKNSHFTTLLIRDCHESHFHTGPNLVFTLLRRRFWILSARNLIRKHLNACNFCFKAQPRPTYPPMADLPAARVQESKPFLHTGVDYAGPFHICISRRRGVKSQKAYLCLFICLATKAVHLELASSLSSDTFLACFKRFVSRRGPVSCLYSDRGTNFIGAKAELDEIHSFLQSDDLLKSIQNYANDHHIKWKFNPPQAPHFGGIWERNIRSLKTHLSKVIGSQILSYEEFTTILVQIEALLNSRPLCPSSPDPTEPEALTPSHFLTLIPLYSLPLSDTLAQTPLHNRKTLLDSIVRSFWKRWHAEYLTSLQSRPKWNTPTNPLRVGTVVIIKNESTAPLHWPLAIVEQVHPGADGIVRVATVRTGKTLYQRPVTKLCPLPTQ